MTEEMRVLLTWLAVLLYGLFAALALRSAVHARRLARQWENSAGDNWQWGKGCLVLAIVGLFIVSQRFEPIPFPWVSVGFFICLGFLLYGEWRIGTGFRDVADAQDSWHRRNFGEDE